MLLKSKESPQLPNSYAMYELITSGIRPGLSTIGKRYAVNTSALNKEKYESMCKVKGTNKYFASSIFKVDENNQYGAAQDGKMPFIGFVERKNPSVQLVKNLLAKMGEETDSHKGYGFFATVSMTLPSKFHDDSMLYSPMIVKTAPQLQWMSALQLRYYGEAKAKQIGYKKITPTEKLMSFFKPVENYCCTDNLLRHLIESGWIMNDVTKLVEFKSKDYLKGINFCEH